MLFGNHLRAACYTGGRFAERNAMRRKGSGFTLVEMLVAMALSLMLILAVTQVFRLIGDNVLAGRAMQEMSSHLRAASDQLQRDLSGLTVPARPWPETGANQGYLEVYEGPFWDLGLGLERGRVFPPSHPSLPRFRSTRNRRSETLTTC